MYGQKKKRCPHFRCDTIPTVEPKVDKGTTLLSVKKYVLCWYLSVPCRTTNIAKFCDFATSEYIFFTKPLIVICLLFCSRAGIAPVNAYAFTEIFKSGGG